MLTMSCTTVNMTYTSPNSNDDLYYSKADAQREAIYHEEVKVQDMSKANTNGYSEDPQIQNKNAVGTGENYSNDAINRVESSSSENNLNNPNYSNGSTDQSYSSDGKTIINNYYGDVYEDDDMGYYSTRIRRFHRSYVGFNYYSPAFCGIYYDPFYSPGWNFGIGFGYSYGYYDPFFNPFYNPWYSPYSPYYGYGGWGGYGNYDAYRWGYNNGYWDGRNDNGYNGGGYYGGGRGGSKNTIIRGPRPTRGGTVSSAGGNRLAPERGGMPAAGSGTESIRSAPPTRTPINSGNPNNTTNTTNTNTNTEIRTAPTRDPIPVRNNSGNGYVPPRVPSSTQSESSPSNETNTQTTPRSETIIRNNNNSNPQPVRINPNYGGQTSSPNIRKSEGQNSRRSETPRVSAPTRSSTPSSPAPSRSSGGNSAPASRPRPR